MITTSIELADLEIIGYADVLANGLGPEIVPPVFRVVAEPTRCFVPPYRIGSRWLDDPKEVDFAEVEELAASRSLSLPPGCRFPAQPNHILWIDPDRVLRYEPSARVEETLRELYLVQIKVAKSALDGGRLNEAERAAGIALSAKPRALDPRAILAVCHAMRGNETEALFLRKRSLGFDHTEEAFGDITKHYAERLPPSSWSGSKVADILRVFNKAGASVGAVFQITEEDYRRFLPLLHQFQRFGKEREILIRCSGIEAELLAEKEMLNAAYATAESWVKNLEKASRLWAIVAEEMLNTPQNFRRNAKSIPQATTALALRLRALACPLIPD